MIEILQEAERQFEIFNVRFPVAMSLVSEVRIWIHREETEKTHPQHWALVVGAKDAPDFGYHIEFEGHEYRGIWAGD